MQKSLYSEEYRSFLDFVKEVRRNAGITQQQLARKLKSTQSFVSKVERGERRLDIIELDFWVRAMGITLLDFVEKYDRHVSEARESRSNSKSRTNI
jgi:transcriptional regulator with XRE-family HTH domain